MVVDEGGVRIDGEEGSAWREDREDLGETRGSVMEVRGPGCMYCLFGGVRKSMCSVRFVVSVQRCRVSHTLSWNRDGVPETASSRCTMSLQCGVCRLPPMDCIPCCHSTQRSPWTGNDGK